LCLFSFNSISHESYDISQNVANRGAILSKDKDGIYSISLSHLKENAPHEVVNSINIGKGTEKVIYSDDDIVIVNKPPFLQTVPGHLEDLSLASIIQDKYNIDSIEHMSPHRLDYQTSGLVIFTKNIKSLRVMQQQFRENQVYKRYSSIVAGKFDDWDGEIDLPIGKDKIAGSPLQTIDINGKPSITNWNVSKVGRQVTKVGVNTPVRTVSDDDMHVSLAHIDSPHTYT
jgi:23S rRNA-/tRNA-specific pseudouridylate synthase